jgi:4-oxalocrotonate tautomerase
MPHVIVKLWPGKSEKQKTQLAHEITRSVMKTLTTAKTLCPLAFEEVEPQDWASQVYQTDIVVNEAKLYKKPGHSM